MRLVLLLASLPEQEKTDPTQFLLHEETVAFDLYVPTFLKTDASAMPLWSWQRRF